MTLTFYRAVHVLDVVHRNSVTDVNGTVHWSTHTSLPKYLSDTFLRALLLNADVQMTVTAQSFLKNEISSHRT